jgi:hypothetical protein
MQLSIPVTSGVGQFDAGLGCGWRGISRKAMSPRSATACDVVFEDNSIPWVPAQTVLDANGATIGTGTMDVNE